MEKKMDDKYLKLVTPKGVAQYPWLTKADTKFNPDGIYKIDLLLQVQEATNLTNKLIAYAKEQFPKGSPKLPFKSELDDSGAKTGNVIFRFKSKKKPTLFDATGTPMDDSVVIYGGSTVKVSASAGAYNAAGNAGITLYLNAVQVIDLVSGSGGGDDLSTYGFAVEDGYKHSGETDFTEKESDSTDGDDELEDF
jgi:hypothetical protein